MQVDASIYEEFRQPGFRFTYVEKIPIASQIVAALRGLSGEGSPDLAACSKLLTEQPFQHSALIKAFENRELHKLEGTPLVCDDPAKWHNWREKVLLSGTADFLLGLKTIINATFASTVFPPTGAWVPNEEGLPLERPAFKDEPYHVPPIDPEIAAYISTLAIPVIPRSSDMTAMLQIHDLGRFRRDPVLLDRINDIFHPQRHTFLINASASGKTRSLYEGLCQHWGLFFTLTEDSGGLGHKDLSEIVLLSRLGLSHGKSGAPDSPFTPQTVLDVFKIDRHQRHHKRLWLCFQLKEVLVSPELADSISNLRKKIDEWYVDDKVIDDAVRETLQELLGPTDPLLSEPLYIALDQANAGRLVHLIDWKHPLFPNSDDDMDGMPMLKVILRIWRSHTKDFDVTYVVAGTQVDSNAFSTDDPEWSSWRWCSNTGDFASDIVRHRAYVEGYFPPKILHKTWGRICVERVLRWCRGRHRTTAAIVGFLLLSAFQAPNHALNKCISSASGYDTDQWRCLRWDYNESFEPELRLYIYRPSWGRPSVSDEGHEVFSACHDALLHLLLLGRDQAITFGPEKMNLVRSGLGRFIDSDMQKITVDDSCYLIHISNSFHYKESPLKLSYYFSDDFRSFREPFPASVFVALTLAYGIGSSQLALSDVLEFSGDVPAWAKGGCRLIKPSAGEPDTHQEFLSFMYVRGARRPTLACISKSTTDMIAWLDGDEQPFICIHAPPSTSPTLFFAIAPESGSPIWIELRVSLDSDVVTDTAVKQILDDMTLDRLFVSPDILVTTQYVNLSPLAVMPLITCQTCTLDNVRQLLGGRLKWPVVRVVAPVYSSLAGESFTVPKCTEGPVAILNMASLDTCIDKDKFPDIICIMKDVLVSITEWVQPKRKLWLDQPLRFFGESDDSGSEGDWTESDSEDERSESNRHRRDRLVIIADLKRRNIRV